MTNKNRGVTHNSLKLAEICSLNASHARRYNRVTTRLYLSQKREEEISIKLKRKETEKWVRKSVMHGESISTPHIHFTPWELF